MKNTILCGFAAVSLLGAAGADAAPQPGAFLGAQMAPLTPNIRRDLDIKISKGAAIGDVIADSPAAMAGLKGKDVIVGIDKQAVASPQDVIAILAGHRPGDRVTVQLLDSDNGHREKTVDVTLGVRPAGFQTDAQPGTQPVPE